MSHMHQLDSDNTEAFLERFCTFYDSTIDSVAINYNDLTAEHSVEIRIQAMDNQGGESAWATVRLVLAGKPEFTIRESWNRTYCVPGDGARISHFDGRVYLDLDTLEGDENTIDSYRQSNFYVGADRCSWQCEPAG